MIRLVQKGTLEDRLYEYLGQTIDKDLRPYFYLKKNAPLDLVNYFPLWYKEHIEEELLRMIDCFNSIIQIFERDNDTKDRRYPIYKDKLKRARLLQSKLYKIEENPEFYGQFFTLRIKSLWRRPKKTESMLRFF